MKSNLIVLSDKEKAIKDLSGENKGDERKRTNYEVPRRCNLLLKPRILAVSGMITEVTCLLTVKQPLLSWHDLYSGLFMELGNILKHQIVLGFRTKS